MKYVPLLFFTILLTPVYGQITGDWFVSHSYNSGRYVYGEEGFSYKHKKKQEPSLIWSLSESSLEAYSINDNNVIKVSEKISLKGDTLILHKNKDYLFKIHSFADSLILTENHKGTSIVLLKVNSNRKKILESKTLSILTDNSFVVNTELFFSSISENPKCMESRLTQKCTFKSNNELVLGTRNNDPCISQNSFNNYSKLYNNWLVVESAYNLYLVLGTNFLQIQKLTSKGFSVREYQKNNGMTHKFKLHK